MKYKLAFIGGGENSIAGYPHFIASQMDNKFEVVAGVFSSNPQINKNVELSWNVKSYNTYEEMIASVDIDAVVILTPTPLHFEAIKYLIEKNIPVICEKPLVSSMEDAEILESIIDSKFLIITNNYSGYPMLRELRERIIQGELGNILNIKLEMPQETFLRPPKSIKYPQKWRLKDDYIPMICLDLGVHLHHLSKFLLAEEPISVLGDFNSFSSYDVYDDVKLLLKFKDTKRASLWISKSALGNRNGLTITVYGSKASAQWIQEKSEELIFSFSNGEKQIVDRGSNCLIANNKRYNRMTSGHPAGFIEAFANVYWDIAAALKQYRSGKNYKSEYIYGIEHAKDGLKLFHKAKKSYENQKWENING